MANGSERGESVRLGRFKMPLPRSRLLRILIGVLLLIGGVFSFLPILGVWMIPLGLLVLSIDIPRVRRWRRRFAVWFHRRYPKLAAKLNPSGPNTNANGDGEPPVGSHPVVSPPVVSPPVVSPPAGGSAAPEPAWQKPRKSAY